MNGTPLSDEEFSELLRSFARTATYFECQQTYALEYEIQDLDLFLEGRPVPPPEVWWWKPWLDQIAALTAGGRRISRVRVISSPPTGYQRWQLWSLPWHVEAGERITYLSRDEAGQRLGLPLWFDWWLLDDERVIRLDYAHDGTITGKTLITDPGEVARFITWRDLAVRNATTAESIAAA